MYLNVFLCLHLLAASTVFVLPRLLVRLTERKPLKSPQQTATIASAGESNKIIHLLAEQPNGGGGGGELRYRHHRETTNGGARVAPLHKDNLSFRIREKFDSETRNIENFIDKTVNGISELREDLMTPPTTTPQPIMNNDKQLASDRLNGAGIKIIPSVISNGQAE